MQNSPMTTSYHIGYTPHGYFTVHSRRSRIVCDFWNTCKLTKRHSQQWSTLQPCRLPGVCRGDVGAWIMLSRTSEAQLRRPVASRRPLFNHWIIGDVQPIAIRQWFRPHHARDEFGAIIGRLWSTGRPWCPGYCWLSLCVIRTLHWSSRCCINRLA